MKHTAWLILALPLALSNCTKKSSDSAQKSAAPKENFVYLRCNSTSWDLTENNLLTADGDTYKLKYDVKEQWMVDGGESCVITVTDKKGSWTSETKEYVTVLPDGEAARSEQAYEAKPKEKENFRLKYAALGAYEASVDLKQKQVKISKVM